MPDRLFTPLTGVTLTDKICMNALSREVGYLLSLEEGRLLAGFCENAAIKTPYVRYGGWESKLIGGHTLGHYLAAVSQAVASRSVGEAEREALRARLFRIVETLALCQQNTRGKRGFLWGAPAADNVEAQFDFVERGKTDIKSEAWVPWYTMHKLLAGLVAAYELAGCEKALNVASALGDWVAARTAGWDARTHRRVLSVEYGGMNDVLYELYSVTGNEAYARAAHMFDEEQLFDEILSGKPDVLNNRHANTTIPKILGALNRYLVLHGRVFAGKTVDASRYLRVAQTFFALVSERHTYVTGGNSEWEHFGRDYVLDAERTNCNCETCNVYNMLKLARALFCLTGKSVYADFYDNAFTNSILSSQNPETGMTTYFQPMAGGFFKVFSRPYDHFWCCTGSGMENFTKLGDSAFYLGKGSVSVEQYLAAHVEEEAFAFDLDCAFPLRDAGTLRLVRAAHPVRFRLRIPDWAADSPRLAVGGRRPEMREEEGHIVLTLAEGEELTFRIPVAVSLMGLPDGDALAFRYGGAVLCADLGAEDMEETDTGVDVRIPRRRVPFAERIYFPDLSDVLEFPEKYLVRAGEKFTLRGGDVAYTFGMYNRQYRGRYAIYFRLSEGERTAERAEREVLDAVQVGYGQYERDELHALSERGSVSVASGANCRYARAGGYFAYDLRADPARPCTLSVTLRRADNGRTLRIFLGGEKFFEERLLYTMGEEIYTREIPLPADLLSRAARSKQANGETCTVVNVRFEGAGGRVSPRLCDRIAIYIK